MTEEKWVVEIGETKYHIWATDMSDALEQAMALGAVSVYKFHENEIQNEPVTEMQSNSINEKIIEAMTDQELCRAADRINEELNNRNVGTVTIPNYANLMKED